MRNGRKVRILCTDGPYIWDKRPQPVIGIIEGDKVTCAWSSDGVWMHGENSIDLVNVPEKRTVWCNFYNNRNNDGGVNSGGEYKTASDAKKGRSQGCIACVEVHFEEGQGL